MLTPQGPGRYDQGLIWAIVAWVRSGGRLDASGRPREKRGCVWNLLGCLIPLAFLAVCFAVLWFLGLSNVLTHPPHLP